MPWMISIDLRAIFVRDARRFLDQHGDQHHALVQHVIVLDELRQRERHALGRRRQEYGGARQPRVAAVDGGLDQVLFRLAQLAARPLDQLDAAAPGQHQERDDAGEQQRKPAALEQLGRVRGEEDAVDDEEEAVDRDHDDRRIAPLDRDQRRQQRGDRHQQRHRDAIGAGERVRRAEAEHGAQRRRRQQPVDQRHIDLADRVAGGVLDVHARQEAELDRLLGQRKHARDDRLRGDHGGERREARPAGSAPSPARAGRTDCRSPSGSVMSSAAWPK